MTLKAVAAGGGSGTGSLTPSQQAAQAVTPSSLLPKTRAALGRVRNGTGRGKILCIGDSTTQGTGGTETTRWPSTLARMFGANANALGNFGQQIPDGGIPWIVLGSGWTKGTGAFTGLGGNHTANTTTTTSMTVTPPIAVDTFIYYYIDATGSFTYSVNGGSATTVNGGGGSTLKSVTISCPNVGINTLTITRVSGTCVMVGFDAYNSTITALNVLNAGWGGSQSGQWATNNSQPYGPLLDVVTISADLVIINLTINDYYNGVSPAGALASMTTIITNAKTVSDVILMTGVPSNPTANPPNTNVVNQLPIIANYYTLAASFNVPLVDVYGRWISYNVSGGPGLGANTLYFDNLLHPNPAGYADNAQAVFNMIGNL